MGFHVSLGECMLVEGLGFGFNSHLSLLRLHHFRVYRPLALSSGISKMAVSTGCAAEMLPKGRNPFLTLPRHQTRVLLMYANGGMSS